MLNRNEQLLGAEARKARSVSKTLRRLWDFLSKYKLALILTSLFVLASTYMQVLIPDLIGQAADCFLGPLTTRAQIDEEAAAQFGQLFGQQGGAQDAFANCWYTTPDLAAPTSTIMGDFSQLILLVIGLYVFSALLSGLQFYLMSYAGYYALGDMRRVVFKHMHRLSLGFFSKNEAGDVMSRFTNDTDTLQQIIGFGLVSVIQGVLLIIWIVITMLRKSVPFALLSLITLPLMFIATQWFSNQARKAFRKARQEIGSVNADLQESIAAVREVQAFSREDENIEQFREQNASNRDANIRAQAYTSALAPTLEALSYISLAVVAGAGGYFILSGGGNLLGTTISVGLIITFIGYVQQFNRPVQQIALLWTNIQSAVAGAERIFDLLDSQPDVTDKADALTMPEIKGHVQLKNVWAAYNPDEPVLRGIDIEAKPGEMIAIVGPTGAGKTTVINLLPRFWDVTQGAVIIDDCDVRDVTRQSLREQIGVVLQDTFLFSDSVLNNIRYGRPDATDEDVIAAAKLARAHNFIVKLEDGYDTVLGERGSGLSQGQRQLLAIARVALTDPRLLILDEATSSVDTRTEREIQAALEQLLAGRTSFVIAHRLSTIRNADQVLVLKDGHIIEQGTHDSLLEANGFYHNLYMSQFKRQEA